MSVNLLRTVLGQPRSSGWTPATLSPIAWYPPAGASNGIWSDISGNNRHVENSTVGDQPIIVTNVKNGKQVRRFVSNDSLFNTTNISGTNYSFVIVANFIANASTHVIFRNGTTGGYRLDRRPTPTSQINMVHSGQGDVVSTAMTDGWHIISVTRRAGTPNAANIWVDNTQLVFNITTSLTAPSGNFIIGGTGCVSDIGEIICFDRELTSGERTQLVDYLNSPATGWNVY